jgi:hypothetical protein
MHGQIREYLAYHRRELETMAGEPARIHDVRIMRVPINYKALVRRHGVQTGQR